MNRQYSNMERDQIFNDIQECTERIKNIKANDVLTPEQYEELQTTQLLLRRLRSM